MSGRALCLPDVVKNGVGVHTEERVFHRTAEWEYLLKQNLLSFFLFFFFSLLLATKLLFSCVHGVRSRHTFQRKIFM